MRGIPWRVKNNDPVSSNQVDAQTSSPGGNQEKAAPEGKRFGKPDMFRVQSDLVDLIILVTDMMLYIAM